MTQKWKFCVCVFFFAFPPLVQYVLDQTKTDVYSFTMQIYYNHVRWLTWGSGCNGNGDELEMRTGWHLSIVNKVCLQITVFSFYLCFTQGFVIKDANHCFFGRTEGDLKLTISTGLRIIWKYHGLYVRRLTTIISSEMWIYQVRAAAWQHVLSVTCRFFPVWQWWWHRTGHCQRLG